MNPPNVCVCVHVCICVFVIVHSKVYVWDSCSQRWGRQASYQCSPLVSTIAHRRTYSSRWRWRWWFLSLFPLNTDLRTKMETLGLENVFWGLETNVMARVYPKAILLSPSRSVNFWFYNPTLLNSVHDASISYIGSTKWPLWQHGLLLKSSNGEVLDKKAAKFSNPCRVLSQIQIRKLSSRHFPHLIGFSLPSCWTFSACSHWWWWWWCSS